MRKILLIILIALVNNSFTCAQQSFFNTDVLYYNTQYEQWPVQVDTIFTENGDITMVFKKQLEPVSSTCFDTLGSPLLGYKLIKKSNGNYVFFNHVEDSIHIFTNQSVGYEWICWQQGVDTVFAHIENKYQDTVFGQVDQLTNVVFESSFGSDVFDYEIINNGVLIIGENNGVIQTFHWGAFPEQITTIGIGNYYYLTSQESFINNGWPDYQSTIYASKADIFDLRPGEEWHIEKFEIADHGIMGFDFEHQKWIGLTRVETEQNIIYGIELHQRIGYDSIDEEWNRHRVITELRVDTITRTYSRTDFSLSKPFVLESEWGGDVKHLGLEHKRPFYAPFCYAHTYDSCLELTDFEYFYYTDYVKYIKGLGGPYYHFFDDERFEDRNLVYFKKQDGQEWGSPLGFEEIRQSEPPTQIKVFPNPATYQINISGLRTHNTYDYRVVDITGKVSLEGTIDRNTEEVSINLGSLNQGLYLLVLNGNNQQHICRFVKN